MDIYAALVVKRAYRLQFTHANAFSMNMEQMGGQPDQQLLQAFRPVAFSGIETEVNLGVVLR